MGDDKYLTVGQLAKKMDVTVRTLQYYDKQNLLKPSYRSSGNRRLYTDKDVIKLHQIISFKYLGFSLKEIQENLYKLETPKEVISVLGKQKDVIKSKIEDLNKALDAITDFEQEVSTINYVDFGKYADIIACLKIKSNDYWITRSFDDKLLNHIRNKENIEKMDTFNIWMNLCKEIKVLKNNGYTPDSKKGQDVAKRWWDMVMDFTGGDMSMLPSLLEFNDKKDQWDKEYRDLQANVDDFISEALGHYFSNNNVEVNL